MRGRISHQTWRWVFWLETVWIRGLIIFLTDQIGAMIAHVALFWGPYCRDCFKLAYRKEQPDPHYKVSMALFWEQLNSPTWIQAMQKYKETPIWWYAILICLSFIAGKPFKFFIQNFAEIFLGLIVIFKGQTTLPWWSYIVALLLGAFITVNHIP